MTSQRDMERLGVVVPDFSDDFTKQKLDYQIMEAHGLGLLNSYCANLVAKWAFDRYFAELYYAVENIDSHPKLLPTPDIQAIFAAHNGYGDFPECFGVWDSQAASWGTEIARSNLHQVSDIHLLPGLVKLGVVTDRTIETIKGQHGFVVS